ncbi:1-acyl-sn-glycerol-3-phosphate acyltransferase [Mobilicoccus pelagius]|uniref:Putative acyltransferase n=1 Tax=Mobilicoccus pelagius NBRC 104925 TaxID=1089455 RepID=H5UUS4_9MICO|nr:1-acyl-sn-glycerol-3-phosphate acyltransferase [Mobilicoccus pelagius]GAB49482.1 putative acyltransferase [Mobilicoccus pelagius NBRC 104925]
MLYWFFKLVLIGPVLRVLFRPWVEGAEHVPAHGPAILASNHLSFSDSIFLPLMCPRRITFPAKSDYFTQPGLVGRLKKAFFQGTGQIPIDRSGGAASKVAMDAGLAVLQRGELFGIYPEGTRSPDGRLYRGKTGIARLALAAGVPIIPVAMIDTDKAQPTGQRIPTIMQVGMRFGPPMDFSEYADRADDHEVLREITDEVMAALQELSGQEYVDEYAATVKEQLAARANDLLAAARAEGANVQARASDLVASAKAESATVQANVQARASDLVASAKAEGAQAQARAEELIQAARTEVEQRRRRRAASEGATVADAAPVEADGQDDVGDDGSSRTRP